MPGRGIFVGDAGGRLRLAGQLVELSSAGRDGSYKLVIQSSDSGQTVEIPLCEEAVDELEEVIAALRIEQPRYEKTKAFSPLVMKKFMLDNAVFPRWPSHTMVPVYRQEGALITQDEILQWRDALAKPENRRPIYARLMLSTTRREIKDYRRAILDEISDAVRERAPESYSKFGRDAVLNEIEQNLLDAYPNDRLDSEGILATARNFAISQLLPEAVAERRGISRNSISGAFPAQLPARKTYMLARNEEKSVAKLDR